MKLLPLQHLSFPRNHILHRFQKWINSKRKIFPNLNSNERECRLSHKKMLTCSTDALQRNSWQRLWWWCQDGNTARKWRERVSVCVCVCVWEREGVCVSVLVWKKERERVCVSGVRISLREKEIKLNIQRHSCISCIQQGGTMERFEITFNFVASNILSYTPCTIGFVNL